MAPACREPAFGGCPGHGGCGNSARSRLERGCRYPVRPCGDLAGGDPVCGDLAGGNPVRGDPVCGNPVWGDPVRSTPVRGNPARSWGAACLSRPARTRYPWLLRRCRYGR